MQDKRRIEALLGDQDEPYWPKTEAVSARRISVNGEDTYTPSRESRGFRPGVCRAGILGPLALPRCCHKFRLP